MKAHFPCERSGVGAFSVRLLARSFMVGIAIVSLLSGGVARAQERGDVQRGERLARNTCVACHGVEKNQDSSDPRAPSFAQIAAVPGMSDVALHVALTTSHRAMPNLVLEARERADAVAYILSLR
jgi:mono/diheme cytochrome c family protein